MKTIITICIVYLLIGLIVDTVTGSIGRHINWAVVLLWPVLLLAYAIVTPSNIIGVFLDRVSERLNSMLK